MAPVGTTVIADSDRDTSMPTAVLGGAGSVWKGTVYIRPGSNYNGGFVRATGPRVTPYQRRLIQKEARAFGCWTCGTTSSRIYFGDHYPATSLVKKNGLKGRQVLLPQCPSCSARQGGFVSSLTRKRVNRGMR